MTYDAIKKYLVQQMKMSHVYQPVMLKRLLIEHGSAKVEEIALDLVQNDLIQIDYYTGLQSHKTRQTHYFLRPKPPIIQKRF